MNTYLPLNSAQRGRNDRARQPLRSRTPWGTDQNRTCPCLAGYDQRGSRRLRSAGVTGDHQGGYRSRCHRIAPYVRRTPSSSSARRWGTVSGSRSNSSRCSQPAPSRCVGAFSDLTKASIPTIGVAAASGGNFGLAVAYAAGVLGHRATVFVPETSPPRRRSEGSPTSGRMSESSPAITKPRLPLRANGARGAGAHEVHAYDHPERGGRARDLRQGDPGAGPRLRARSWWQSAAAG